MTTEHTYEKLLNDNKEEVIYTIVNDNTVVRITKEYCEVLKNGLITQTIYYGDADD